MGIRGHRTFPNEAPAGPCVGNRNSVAADWWSPDSSPSQQEPRSRDWPSAVTGSIRMELTPATLFYRT